MPLHDWTRVPVGLFHHFHQDWSIEIARELNRGRLSAGTSALVEQRSGPREADVLAIESASDDTPLEATGGGSVAIERLPATKMVHRTNNEMYARLANRIVIRHHLGRILAVLEIVSPGNKDSRAALRDFVDKTVQFLRSGIHVLIVDLFPPSARDPGGIHQAIWEEIGDDTFTFPDGKNRTLVSYRVGAEHTAYIEPVAVGDSLPEMPLFLSEAAHILVPLEATYETAWHATPNALRQVVETGIAPNDEEK